MSPSPHRVLPAVPRRVPPRLSRLVLPVAGVAAVAVSLVVPAAAPAGAESVSLSPTGSLVVTLRGNGHGHGMSQYGAEGAATKGLSFSQILAFYYPGATLSRLKPSTIRVKLSGFPKTVTVAAYSGLTVTGQRGGLGISGVKKYRLAPSGKGFALQQLKSAPGSTWRTVRTGLPDGSEFWRSGKASTRLYRSDGSSVRYLGVLRAVRSGSGSYTVNRTSLDNYTAGVVPSEIPTSWRAQAVNAQAVAARSYGRYAVENEARPSYDICDTTQCQVYGGRAQYDRSGRIVARDYQPAATATADRVLRYKGRTVFAQFAASNGGYMASGGQPYLRSKADPYDAGAPGNPYMNYTRKVSVRSLASQFGFAKLTGLAITKRDGGGAWGGRVLSARLTGTGSNGKARSTTVSGDDLQWAMGVGTTLFTVRRG